MRTQIVFIYNRHLDNFLQEYGLRPVVEEQNRSGYRRNKRFAALVEKYDIYYRLFPNRHL